ncbi:branched-chain amino acid transport system ATP-binding protein [Modestobacter sp. DSM 44400]|uniref:ABC transporter ATP-binding protein n=1 Tax=Modestobacter sp. DSM 44400 TaxID=1550230 RepID=UPI00089B55E2|nr:ABC transporter ATP-binding protein [Modestobacter sp. DSM 44400]SDY75006.1 branched-chain amino acid transport system ATP-binding protein [Modestobacter sp. DSM 44400]
MSTGSHRMTTSPPGADLPADTVLEVSGVTAGYTPSVPILEEVSLHVGRQELVGIFGPNGAGKSTLLKAVFGLVSVSEGGVRFDGVDITGAPSHELVGRGVGFVPQLDNVFPRLSVRDNLRMGSYLRPKDFGVRWEALAELFPRLVERMRARAGSLSGGERQMLAMARALMPGPRLLCLDEPSAGLSPRAQTEVFALISRINETGTAVLIVEQNARRCLAICDRGYILDQGRNAVTGTGRELLDDPAVVELYLGRLGAGKQADPSPTATVEPRSQSDEPGR